MKTNLLKSFLTLAFVSSLALPAAAEEAADYKPLLTEGKSWLMADCHSYGDWSFDTQYMVQIYGDAVVGGIECKILEKYNIGSEAEGEFFYVVEKDRKIYRLTKTEDSETPELDLLMDFSMTTGDCKPLYGDLPDGMTCKRIVTDDKTISAQGADYRLLQMDIVDNGSTSPTETGYWVEGIGACSTRDIAWNWDYLYVAPISEPQTKTIMVSCYQDGQKIFDYSDFCGATYTYKEPAKILTEGKSWLMAGELPFSDEVRYFNFSVGADTIIGETPCKEIEYYDLDKPEDKFSIFACEINGRLFVVSQEDEGYLVHTESEFGTRLPILDIAAPASGQPLRLYEHETGKPVGYYDDNHLYNDIGDGNFTYHFKLTSQTANDSDVSPTRATIKIDFPSMTFGRINWVEGIGASIYNYGCSMTPLPFAGTLDYIQTYYMVECYQDGEVIFKQSDFTWPYAGINEVNAEAEQANDLIYDLQGRRVATPAPGSLYIQNGRLLRN